MLMRRVAAREARCREPAVGGFFRMRIPHELRRGLSSVCTVAALGSALLGCGEPPEAGDVEAKTGEIIGGTVISAATRRAQGLIDLPGCSGSLLTPDWVLTARHCVDFVTVSNNAAQAVRADGGLDLRRATQAISVGTTEMALLKLGSGPATWPSVTRSLPQALPSTFAYTNVTCYGKGMSGYASPSGLTSDGLWRQLSKPLANYNADQNVLYMGATSTGQDIVAFGDSGGPCFQAGQPVATVWGGELECTDRSTYERCVATVTKIPFAWFSAVSSRTIYLRETLNNRAMAAFQPLTTVNGWVPSSSYKTDHPMVALVNGTVHLRGGLVSGTAAKMFTLPPGYRPAATVYVPTNVFLGGKGRLIIEANGDVSVGTEGAFSSAQSYTSLDGVSFQLNTAGHVAMTLQNGWTNTIYGTRAVAAAAFNGVVRFQGAMQTNGSNSAPFVVPSGLRPSTRVYVPVDLCNAQKGRLIIEPTGTVTVDYETSFSAAACFTSLEGAFYPMNNSGFSTLTPLNGWVGGGYSTRAPAVRNDNGVVVFQGSIASGTTSQAFTLPERFRPATDVWVDADMCGAKKGRVLIKPTGEVSMQPYGTFSDASCFTSLESVQFGI
jgi:hypothetical protein